MKGGCYGKTTKKWSEESWKNFKKSKEEKRRLELIKREKGPQFEIFFERYRDYEKLTYPNLEEPEIRNSLKEVWEDLPEQEKIKYRHYAITLNERGYPYKCNFGKY